MLAQPERVLLSPAASRAKRKARAPRSLSRPEILAAGLRIARADDLQNLTMKSLGDALGVTAMAVYRHFASKDELIDGILDHFVQTAEVVGHRTDPREWRLWLRRTTVAQHRALAETPGVLPFVATSRGWRFGPAANRVREQTLAVLRDAGFGRREAAERVTALLALAVGWATIEADAAGLERAIDRLLD